MNDLSSEIPQTFILDVDSCFGTLSNILALLL